MTHPMIDAIGEDKFRKILSSFPQYYNNDHIDNYKPVTMTLIWLQHFDNLNIAPDEARSAILGAHLLWKNGLSLEEACKTLIRKAKPS